MYQQKQIFDFETLTRRLEQIVQEQSRQLADKQRELELKMGENENLAKRVCLLEQELNKSKQASSDIKAFKSLVKD